MSYTAQKKLNLDDLKRLKDKYNSCTEFTDRNFMNELFHGLDFIIEVFEKCDQLSKLFDKLICGQDGKDSINTSPSPDIKPSGSEPEKEVISDVEGVYKNCDNCQVKFVLGCKDEKHPCYSCGPYKNWLSKL